MRMFRTTGPNCAVMFNSLNTCQVHNVCVLFPFIIHYIIYVHIRWSIYSTRYIVHCVCVFFPFILDVKFVGCTSRGHTGGRSHMISHPPSFCGACLYFSREKDSAVPFPANDLIVLHLMGIYLLLITF